MLFLFHPWMALPTIRGRLGQAIFARTRLGAQQSEMKEQPISSRPILRDARFRGLPG
jgi:hypothetical protein